MALGCGMWLCTQILWTYFEVFLRQEVPNPFVGDVVLFLHVVPMMAALVVQPHFSGTTILCGWDRSTFFCCSHGGFICICSL